MKADVNSIYLSVSIWSTQHPTGAKGLIQENLVSPFRPALSEVLNLLVSRPINALENGRQTLAHAPCAIMSQCMYVMMSQQPHAHGHASVITHPKKTRKYRL